MFFAVASLAAVGLRAQVSTVAQSETFATLKARAGTATVKLIDGSTLPATVGMKLPRGAEILTGAGAQATVELHDGIVAVLGEKADVTLEQLSVGSDGVRTGLVDLKSGTIASSLDPKRKSTNNYAVKTAKGVAAARGTTYAVTYNGAVYSCTVVAGRVSNLTVQQFTTVTTAYTDTLGIYVGAGQTISTSSSNSLGQPIPIAQALAAEGGSATSARQAGALAGVTQTQTTTTTSGTDAAQGLALLAAAVASVSTNVQDVAAVIQMIAASAGNSANATKAVAAATAAAASTAATNPNLNGGTNGIASTAAATDVASTIVQAAISGSTQAGNAQAAGTIVTTTVVAVAATTNTSTAAAQSSVAALANALTQAANTTLQANNVTATVNATSVTNGATTAVQHAPVGSATTATSTVNITNTTTTTTGGTTTTTTPTATTVTTPITPIDPTIVSPSGRP